jgi:hypothetical protein
MFDCAVGHDAKVRVDRDGETMRKRSSFLSRLEFERRGAVINDCGIAGFLSMQLH